MIQVNLCLSNWIFRDTSEQWHETNLWPECSYYPGQELYNFILTSRCPRYKYDFLFRKEVIVNILFTLKQFYESYQLVDLFQLLTCSILTYTKIWIYWYLYCGYCLSFTYVLELYMQMFVQGEILYVLNIKHILFRHYQQKTAIIIENKNSNMVILLIHV